MTLKDKGPWQHGLTMTLALLAPFNLLASLAMDIYLPVVPAMPRILETSPEVVQLTLTLYMLGLGLGQLLFGPVSDRIGRRPVLVGGVVVFIAATGALGSVSGGAAFVALRLVQAAAASAMLVAVFATIRDAYGNRPESGMIYSVMNAMLAFVPAAGPVVGAAIAGLLGWRWIFWLLAGVSFAAAVWVLPNWRETRRVGLVEGGPRIGAILGSRAFWAYTSAFGAAMGTFFVFFSTAPRVLIERAGLGEMGFSLGFATVALVMIGVSRFAPRAVARWGTAGTALRGLGLIALGAALLIPGQIVRPQSPLGFIAPMWVAAVGIVLVGAVSANGALARFGDAAGIAVALHFCVQSLITAGVGTGFVLALGGATAWPLVGFAVVMAAVSALWIAMTEA